MIGNYWDWSFPYFTGQLENIFRNQAYSWIEANFGEPLSYVSGYYANFALSLSRYLGLKPELFLGLLLLALGMIVVVLMWLLLSPGKRWPLVALVAAAGVLNQAVYYKLMAGHLGYYLSYVLCLGMLWFLLKRFSGSRRDYIALGLLVGLGGMQIQFFVYNLVILAVYFFYYKEKLQVKRLVVAGILVVLVNVSWLSNFLVGVNRVGDVASIAASQSFGSLMFASPLQIMTQRFSGATNIGHVYGFAGIGLLTLFSLILLSLFVTYLRGLSQFSDNSGITSLYRLFQAIRGDAAPHPETQQPDGSHPSGVSLVSESREILFLASCCILFSIFITGMFHRIPLPILKTIYPMFRESGHAVPLFVLFELLLVGKLLQSTAIRPALRNVAAVYLAIFCLFNVAVYWKYLPRVDYALARTRFEHFERFGETDRSSYRVLTYPFWGEYGFINAQENVLRGKLINDSGWDSFIAFSGKDYLQTNVPAGKGLTETWQYRLLQTYDLNELKQKNIKYIYDFSKIYESNFDKYTDPGTYNNDKGIIKNDSHFIEKLIAANPGELTRVSDNIVRLNDYQPRVQSDSLTFTKVNPTEYLLHFENLTSAQELRFLENYNKNWGVYLRGGGSARCGSDRRVAVSSVTECVGGRQGFHWKAVAYNNSFMIGEDSHTKYGGYANAWVISPDEIRSVTAGHNGYYADNSDGSISVDMVLYYRPQTIFYLALATSVASMGIAVLYLLITYKKRR